MKSQILFKKIASLSELESIANKIIEVLPQNAIVLLNGNLAAGKTTLVKEIVKVLDVDVTPTSPTFSLQQIYGNRVFHYDFYRLEYEDLIDLGLVDEFEKEGWHFVEWMPNELKDLLIDAGFEIYFIDINILDNDKREYIMGVIGA